MYLSGRWEIGVSHSQRVSASIDGEGEPWTTSRATALHDRAFKRPLTEFSH